MKTKKIHHMTIRKLKREHLELENKLNQITAHINDWLSLISIKDRYYIDLFNTYYILDKNTDKEAIATSELLEDDALRLNNAIALTGTMNRYYKRFKEVVRTLDEIGEL